VEDYLNIDKKIMCKLIKQTVNNAFMTTGIIKLS